MVVKTVSKCVTDISDCNLPSDNPFSAFRYFVRAGELVKPEEDEIVRQEEADVCSLLDVDATRRMSGYGHDQKPQMGQCEVSKYFEVIFHTLEYTFVDAVPSNPSERREEGNELREGLLWLLRSEGNAKDGLWNLNIDVVLRTRGGFDKLYVVPSWARHREIPGLPVPSLVQPGFDLTAYDIRDPTLENVLVSVNQLVRHDRAKVDLKLRIQFSSQPVGKHDLPYKLFLDVSVSLAAPALFDDVGNEGGPLGESQRRLAYYVFSDQLPPLSNKPDLAQFYGSLHPAPAISSRLSSHIQPPGLKCKLLPFQRRTVQWMLRREGKEIGRDGLLRLSKATPEHPIFWTPVLQPPRSSEEEPTSGQESPLWWINTLTGDIRNEQQEERVHGGLLAEEPGLGKTVESLALILYNTPSEEALGVPYHSEQVACIVTPIKASLIVTPTVLLHQWLVEIIDRTPGLKVLVYYGWEEGSTMKLAADIANKRARAQQQYVYEEEHDAQGYLIRIRRRKVHTLPATTVPTAVDWVACFSSYDIVLCSYATLTRDLGVAKPVYQRLRRENAKYDEVRQKTRSPLVLVEWQRVLMDEVQQVGGGKTAEMVSLIPRRSSFAVSGTPARAAVKDLLEVLRFLGFTISGPGWARMLKPCFSDNLLKIFDTCAVRTCKVDAVGFDIPIQTRYLVPVVLGVIERCLYDQTLETALQRLGLDDCGAAVRDPWVLDTGYLRWAIRKLRTVCIHPQVGNPRMIEQTTKTVGPRNWKFRNIEEVFNDMIKDSILAWIKDRRALVNLRVKRALLAQKATGASSPSSTIEELTSTREEIYGILLDFNQASWHDSAELRSTRPAIDGDERYEPTLIPSTDEEEQSSGMGEMDSGLRRMKVLLHQVELSLSDIYRISNQHDQEHATNEKIECLRRELLHTTEATALKDANVLHENVYVRGVNRSNLEIRRVTTFPVLPGLLIDDANAVIDALQDQADLLIEWKGTLYTLLHQEIADGGLLNIMPYEHFVDTEAQVQSYLTAYDSLLADRKFLLKEESTTPFGLPTESSFEGNFALLKELDAARKECCISLGCYQTLKSILDVMNGIRRQAEGHNPAQKAVSAEYERLCEVLTGQARLLQCLSREVECFRRTSNSRAEYYYQLQALQNSFVPSQLLSNAGQLGVLAQMDRQIRHTQVQVQTASSRIRYLQFVSRFAASERPEAECGRCKGAAQSGRLLDCGHLFCMDCLSTGQQRGRFICPDCRTSCDISATRVIKSPTPWKNRNPIIKYNFIPGDILREISRVGHQGTKINTLIRHLLYIERVDPGSKTIVFSAWVDTIDSGICSSMVYETYTLILDRFTVVAHELRENGIAGVKMSQKKAADRFQDDPEMKVMLLHGECGSSGLNLTAARRIILLEPTVNSAFEVQAIARLDRLGQAQETEVYCYYATDTVEQNILDNAAKRGTSIYTIGNATKPVDLGMAATVEKPVVEGAAQGLKGDFIASSHEMLEVLFPQMFVESKDVETRDFGPSAMISS